MSRRLDDLANVRVMTRRILADGILGAAS